MATVSTRTTNLVFTGDYTGVDVVTAATNNSSPAQSEIKTLSSGANTITVPTGGTVPTCVCIQPPTGNTTSITLKGVTGDTGVRIHNTDPTFVAIDTSVATFVLTCGSSITGVRLIWS
jgi:hypothetical protein